MDQRNASIFSKILHSIAVVVLDYSNPNGAHLLNITATGGAYVHPQNKWKTKIESSMLVIFACPHHKGVIFLARFMPKSKFGIHITCKELLVMEMVGTCA